MSPLHVLLLTFLLALSFPPLFSSVVTPPVTSPSPSPLPVAGHTPSPSPSPISHSPPAPAPAPAPQSSNSSPVPAPSGETGSPSPAPGVPSDIHNQDHADEADSKADHSSRLKGAQKAGIAFGVIAAAAVVGAGALVYRKRQQNIQRARFGYSTRGDNL